MNKEVLKTLAAHVDEAKARHAEVAERHECVRTGLQAIRDLATRAKRAHEAGNYAGVGAILDGIHDEADLSGDYFGQACDAHRALGRSIRAAGEIVRAGVDAEERDSGWDDPTKSMGAQTSDGQSPRALTPDEIHARDRRRGVAACYAARRKMEGRA